MSVLSEPADGGRRRHQCMSRSSLVFLILASAALHVAALAIPAFKAGHLSAAVRFGCLSPTICYAIKNKAILPENAVVYKSGGYDGQFYFYSAMRVFRGVQVEFDSAPFRLARIGYPVLAGALAGPGYLLYSMYFIPLALHLFVVFFLRSDPLRASIFAFNPISVLSAGLFLADGMALSLLVLALELAFKEKHSLVVLIIAALSMLCKETAAAGALSALFLFLRFRKPVFVALVVACLPMIVWWFATGFSPFFAATRGTAGGPGVWNYVQHPDALLSGRSLLFLFYILGCIVLFRLDLKQERFLAGAALIACGFLLSLTASSEYWDNFANVARLFLPACAGLLLAARQWKGRIVSGTFLFFSLLLLFREAKSVYDIEIW